MKKILNWFQKIIQNLWNWITNNELEDEDDEKIFDEQPSLEEEINSLDRINATDSDFVSYDSAEFDSLLKEIKQIDELRIAFCNIQNCSLAYFSQMADHIQNLYEQAFIDFHLHHLSDPSYAQYLMNHCREAADKLHEQFNRYSKEHWFKSDNDDFDKNVLAYLRTDELALRAAYEDIYSAS